MKKTRKFEIIPLVGFLFIGLFFFCIDRVSASTLIDCPAGAPAGRVCVTPPASGVDNWTTLQSFVKNDDGTTSVVNYWDFLPNNVTTIAQCQGYQTDNQFDCQDNGGTWIPAVTSIVSYYGNCKVPNATLSDGTIVDFCKSVPMSSFMNGIPSCGSDATTINCVKSLGSAYTEKIETYKAGVIDKLISDSDLDSSKVNSAIDACGGDLACISKVIDGMSGDSSFTQSTSTSITADGPLTASSLSDLINSSNENAGTGATNAASNDPTGMQGLMSGPKVEVTFSSGGSGQTGSKMTATAVPSFFNDNSDPKKLYFTWYLKRKDCGLTDPDKKNPNKEESNEAILTKCDFDGDKKITENDWKIAAARIIVANNFDRTGVDYSKFSGSVTEDTSGFVALPKIKEKEGENNIGWRAGLVRDESGEFYEDNGDQDDVRNCYVNAEKSGFSYELRTTTDISKFNSNTECPTGYHRACIKDQIATCGVYGTPPTTRDFNVCAVDSEKKDTDEDHGGVYCGIKSDSDLKEYRATVTCEDEGALALCVKDGTTETEKSVNSLFKDLSQNVLGVVVGTVGDQNANMCTAIASPDPINSGFYLPNAAPLISAENEKCSVVQDKLINGTKSANGAVAIYGNARLAPKCEFKKGLNTCQHLFPRFPKKEVRLNDGKTVNMEDAVSGDGKFTLEEKQFWGTDPSKESTDGNGTDEQKIVGLGVDEFSWVYSLEDEVGVAVEGDSMFKSEHPGDAAFKRMWAFSKGTCEALSKMEANSTLDGSDPEKNKRAFYMDGSMGIKTSNIDLNSCLKENLIDPDLSGSAKLKVELTSDPVSPVNDPNGNGDILRVASSPVNVQDPGNLQYKWSVLESRSGSEIPTDTTNWVDITNDLKEEGFLGQDAIAGFGKDSFNIDLRLKESDITERLSDRRSFKGVFYLKVKLFIIGSAADGSQSAIGETKPIRIKQQADSIRAYSVSATSAGILSLTPLEICFDQETRKMINPCYVTKNQIIGVVVPPNSKTSATPLSWKVNENGMSCKKAISSDCSGDVLSKGNVLIFPILGNEGEMINVEAIGQDKNNESVNVNRSFIITGSSLRIASADSNAWRKLLGYYRSAGSGGSCFQSGAGCMADLSTQVLETNTGKVVKLNALGQSGYDWAIDGQIIPEFQDKQQITIEIGKESGESYNIGLSTHLTSDFKSQMNNIRLALGKHWGITPTDLIEENQSANIQLDVVAAGSETVAQGQKTTFGASLITHLSQQAMFLLQISLTAFTMLLSVGLLFAIIPESLFRENE